ncbi:hypothetical protein Enr10x_43250 [Gimesia panareensis]|uniref:Uncharacterized protein n=2 Tax=Gimesia panareensis TaxID=2527978 RepID=A0A517QBJ2_9PLAN|nr:hypothetical protein Enr10x_43250 [Gimesia panareensis]
MLTQWFQTSRLSEFCSFRASSANHTATRGGSPGKHCPLRAMHCFALAVLLGFTGCSSGPGNDDLAAFLREGHREVDAILILDGVEITKTEEVGDPPVLNLEFKVKEKSKVDMFNPISMEEAYQEYQYSPEKYNAALKRLNGLRQPERSETAQKLPQQENISRVYRKTVSKGDEINWTGTVTAEEKDGKWIFSGREGKPDESKITPKTVPRDQVPETAVVLDGTAKNKLTELIDQQKQFVQDVDAAEKQMEARLKREHAFLLKTVQSDTAWQALVPAQSGPAAKLRVRFVHQEKDGEKVYVLFEDQANPLLRATWVGALKLTEAPNPNARTFGSRSKSADGWIIDLAPADKDRDFPVSGLRPNIVFTLTGEDQLTWMNQKGPIVLTPDTNAPALPDYETLQKKILSQTAPGQTWEGTIQYKGETSNNLRLTFMDFRDNGNYVRLLVENQDDPFVVGVFEGTISTGPDHLYSWPVQLKTADKGIKVFGSKKILPLFGTGLHFVKLYLMFDAEGNMIGISRSAGSPPNELNLKIADKIDKLPAAADRWKNALKAGARWTGTITRGDQPKDKISMTVAEVRENGRIYRLFLENPDNPHQYRYFSATLDESDGSVDNYALVIEARSPVAQQTKFGHRFTDGDIDLFGRGKDNKNLFRLTPDGKELLCITEAKELIRLSPDATPASKPLDQESVAKLWKQTCVKGSRWRGDLVNTKANQTLEVQLDFITGVDDVGNVDVEISSVKQRKLRMPFKGKLELDDDNVNAFALRLKRAARGIGDSAIFGKSANNGELYFRLSPEGSELIGMAGAPNKWEEFLDLKPLTAETEKSSSAGN